MFKNYLIIAWRNLRKEKTFTFLNVFGLSVAFGTAILLSMYALFELSYDRFHENSDSIYQVYQTEYNRNGAQLSISKPVPFAPALKEEVPGVEKITRYNGGTALLTRGEKQLRMSAVFVDPEFFSIFSFPVIEGSIKPVSENAEIAMTEKAAEKLFGKENPIGKTVSIFIDEQEKAFQVTSIIQDIPDESSLNFEVALNFKSQPQRAYGRNIDRWDNSNHEVYLQLSEGTSPEKFEKATRDFTTRHYEGYLADARRDGVQPDANGQYLQQRLLPITDYRFASEKDGVAVVNRIYPYLVLGIAFLILFIASVNFINMNIAKSSQRLREIGMRKTLGAGKNQLFLQFWGESLLVFLGALLLGLLLANLLLEPFQTLFNTRASFKNVISFRNIFGFVAAISFITFIAGGYPALLLSKLGTLKALKGKLNLDGGQRLRNSLIIVQFCIAILLISGTLVLWNQLEFMRNKDLGFNKEQVITFPLNGKQDDFRNLQLLRNELTGKPAIRSISAANTNLGRGRDHTTSTSVMTFDHHNKTVRTNVMTVDHDYAETVGLEILQGRSFDRAHATDSLSLVINEAMARELGGENILEETIYLEDSIRFSVIGIVKDYNFQELDREIEPLTIFLNPQWNMRYAYIKVAPGNLNAAYDQVKLAWNKIEPNVEFLGSYLDENIDRTLSRERSMMTMITSGSIIAIILSCVGLFAISLLVVSQKRKEIGIRKVVGASVGNITVLLTSSFLKLVGIAFLIATPFAWYFSGKWLENYPYRIELNVWIFLISGLIAFGIAIFTISFRTLRAALQNPVKSLRTE